MVLGTDSYALALNALVLLFIVEVDNVVYAFCEQAVKSGIELGAGGIAHTHS